MRKKPTARQKEALELYIAGIDQQSIARQIGVSEQTVCEWKKRFAWDEKSHSKSQVQEALAQLGSVVQQQVQAHVIAAQQQLAHARTIQDAFNLVCAELRVSVVDYSPLSDTAP